VILATTVRQERFVFDDLRTLLTRANEEKSGDRLTGIAAGTERERVAAKCVLAELTLREIVACPLIDPDVAFDCGTPRPRLLRVRDPFGKLVVKVKGSVRIDGAAIFDAAEGD
jgi:hypothetical protein